MSDSEIRKMKKKDFEAPFRVRWCPGCGNYAILNSVQSVFAEIGLAREKFAVISGIGCSSRFPYYMNTYGFHTVHGRAPTIATGLKVANSELSVWVITGDGDGLSIGGNHLLHALRRDIDINILLFNNRIYGLTKGQYSPTSYRGQITKTSPQGTIENPINPIVLSLTSGAGFVARTYDSNPGHMKEMFRAAYEHKGVSIVEILQTCVIFNKDAHEDVIGRHIRDDRLLRLEEGKPLIFGKTMDKGIVLNGLFPKVGTLGKEGIQKDDVLLHYTKGPSTHYAHMLSQFTYPEFPVPVGIFRDENIQKSYEKKVEDQQVQSREAKGLGALQELLQGEDYWTLSEDQKIHHVGAGKGKSRYHDEMMIMDEQAKDQQNLDDIRILRVLKARISKAIEGHGTFHAKSVSPWDSLNYVIGVLKDNDYGCLLVLDKGNLVGVISEMDILNKVIGKNLNRDEMRVESVMTSDPQTIRSWNTIGDAINKFSHGNFRHLPVVGEDNEVGLISVKGIMTFINDTLYGGND